MTGTAMSVREIAARYRDGETAEDIADDIPDIPRSHIHAAIAYYLANRMDLDAQLDEEAALYARMAKEHSRKAS